MDIHLLCSSSSHFCLAASITGDSMYVFDVNETHCSVIQYDRTQFAVTDLVLIEASNMHGGAVVRTFKILHKDDMGFVTELHMKQHISNR